MGYKMIDIEQIWKQYHKTSGDYYRNLLMEHYKHLVKDVAERLNSKLPDEAKLDDLIAAGVFGLMDAIEAFEPAGGLKFEAYCKPIIRVSILLELQSMNGVPQSVRERAHYLKDNAKKQFLMNFLKGPTRAEKMIVVLNYYEEMIIEEIAKELDLSESRISEMHSAIIARCRSYLQEQGLCRRRTI